MHMREETTGSKYDFWSWFYDRTFGLIVRKKQRRAVELLRLKAGDRVLDLGVGTGLTLEYYPSDTKVVGMDLSRGMLKKAQKRITENNLAHCELIQGDALAPPFAEASFDHILITHVISVVSDPPRLLRLAQKLVKPGGRVVVLNHFQSTKPAVAWVEKALNPFFVKVGWKSDLAMEAVLEPSKLRVDYVFKDSVIDLWRIIVLTRPLENAQNSQDNQDVDDDLRPDLTETSAAYPDAPLAIDGI